MRRRLLVARSALCACGLAMIVGCTFLIDFPEVPRTGDGGPDSSSIDIGPPDVTVDANPGPDASLADAGPDVRDAIANPDACKGHQDGRYCGGDQITWPGSRDDLVTCKSGQVSLVRFCTTGQGCIGMLNGFPDECDECAKKADGTYCGRDLPGWDVANAQQRVRCQASREVGLLLCTVCKSAGINSSCQ